LLAGELVSPMRKKHLEKIWGVPVYLFFGSTETGGLFMTCEHGNYHLTHPNVKVEVVDDKGELLEKGNKGNAVLSTAREGMPLLRYYNHDVIELRESDFCSCGNPHPVMIHYGRKDDMVAVGKEMVSFYELQEAVYSLNTVPFMWKVKTVKDKIVFIFQYVHDLTSSFKDIKDELTFKLGFPIELELNEIIPLTQLTEIPAYSKYAHIEHEMAGSK
jgi:phenylacetate-CoA ligase